MATAKKTSKKPATKKRSVASVAAGKKTTAKKVVTKQSATSNIVKNEVKGAGTKQMVTLAKLKNFNFFAAAINVVFAILSATLLSNKAVEFYLPYSTKDELASTQTTVLGPVYQVVATFELRYLLVVIFGLGAVFALLSATVLRARYEAGISSKAPAVRWIFMGIISALSLEFASLLGGVTDIVTLKLIAGLVLLSAILAWVSEKQITSGVKNLVPFYVGLLAGAMAWIPLLVGLVGTSINGMQAFEFYVYGVAVVLFIGFASLIVTHYRYLKNVASVDYVQIEGKYMSADFLVRVAFFVVVFIGLYK